MKLTIFTPTFNRAHTLKRLYNSLLSQTNQDFEWLVVDDGSTDDTLELVTNWIDENKINIKYFYQSNSGKHIAHNKGVEEASGELFTCLDSDDWFYNDAVENILKATKNLNHNINCGLIGLDTYHNGEIVGDKFPKGKSYSNWYEIIFKNKIRGDKTIIFITSIVKKYPFPESSDKHMPPSYQLFQMSNSYTFKLINTPLKYVEYLEDGITKNIRSQYKKAPNNYILYRIEMLNLKTNLSYRMKSLILLNVARRYAEKKIKDLPLKFYYKVFLYLINPFTIYYVNYIERKK